MLMRSAGPQLIRFPRRGQSLSGNRLAALRLC
jgi:hypothetical protein